MLHRLANADAVESVIGSRNSLALKIELVLFSGQCMNSCDRIFIARINAVGGAKLFCESKFLVIKIHRNDWIGTRHARADHCRQTDAANTKNRHALALLHLCGINHCPCTGHNCTADNGSNIFINVGVYLHNVLLVSNGVVCPSEHVLGLRNALADFELGCHRRLGFALYIARYPGNHDHVAGSYMFDPAAYLGHDSG